MLLNEEKTWTFINGETLTRAFKLYLINRQFAAGQWSLPLDVVKS